MSSDHKKKLIGHNVLRGSTLSELCTTTTNNTGITSWLLGGATSLQPKGGITNVPMLTKISYIAALWLLQTILRLLGSTVYS